MNFYVKDFILALIFTDVTETIVLFCLLWYVFKIRVDGWQKIIIAGLFASFMTLPYVWFVFTMFFWQKNTYVIVSEMFAFIMEAIFYRFFLKLDWKMAFLASLLCNAVSFLLGLLLF